MASLQLGVSEFAAALKHADGNTDKKRIQGKLNGAKEAVAAVKEAKRQARLKMAQVDEERRKAEEAARKAAEEAARMLAMQEKIARRKAEKETAAPRQQPEPEEYTGKKRRAPSPNPRGINLWAYVYADVCQKVSLADVEATFDQVDGDNGWYGMLEREQVRLAACLLVGQGQRGSNLLLICNSQLLLVCELLGLVCEELSQEVVMMVSKNDDVVLKKKNG